MAVIIYNQIYLVNMQFSGLNKIHSQLTVYIQAKLRVRLRFRVRFRVRVRVRVRIRVRVN